MINTVNKKVIAITSTVLFISGCVSPTNLNINKDYINNWSLDGKIAIVYPEQDCTTEICTKKSDQGKIKWTQNKDNYIINISDPFGKTIYSIKGNENSATIKTATEQKTITEPQQFLKNNLKIDVSPKTLAHWLTGRPDEEFAITKNNNMSFEQKGFNIVTKQWRDTKAGSMPSFITISKDNSKMRVVAKSWHK